uniref:Uncharacterized protein n=1 Tax=Nelumbo nucifera TaxID=4432 RepID=A0A822ZG81_NELNU|nr:TPA_asm: hypothetical protein HUJ06_001740 [Nelumbo nucifera]
MKKEVWEWVTTRFICSDETSSPICMRSSKSELGSDKCLGEFQVPLLDPPKSCKVWSRNRGESQGLNGT